MNHFDIIFDKILWRFGAFKIFGKLLFGVIMGNPGGFQERIA
jgi:hypothetical protein